METKPMIETTANSGSWNELLKEFHGLIDGKSNREDFEKLKEKAKNNANLTVRQSEGIVARCNNVLNGTYGTSKDAFEIGGKPSHKKAENEQAKK